MVESTKAKGGMPRADWLLAAAAAAVLFGFLALSGGLFLHFVGYALASLLAFTLVAMFRRQSLEQSVKAGIGIPRWMNLAAWALLFVGFAVAVAHSWFIASYFS